MNPSRLHLSAAILLLSAALSGAPTSIAPPPRILMQGHTLSGGQLHHKWTIDLMAEAGVQMMRDEIFWHAVEPRPGKLAIPADALANLKYNQSKGIKTLVILDYANANYDGNNAPHTPEGREAYARYAEFMARETKGLVDYFEIWNEPNLDGFWTPRANAKDYAELVKVAYPAIKRGNPDATVVAGALSGPSVEFTEAVLKESTYNFFDAWSVHPYITPSNPDHAKLFEGQLAAVRSAMQPYGEPKPLWVTECGYPTHEGGVTEAYQADMLARCYIGSMTQPWQPVFGWYWFGPDGPDAALNEDRFGLIRHDWSKKPSFDALKTVTGYLNGTEYIRPLVQDPRVSAFLFKGASGFTTAIWSRDRESHQVRVANVPRANLVNVTGMGFPLQAYADTLWLDATRSAILLSSAAEPKIDVLGTPALELKPDSTSITASASVAARIVLHNVPKMDKPAAVQVPRLPNIFAEVGAKQGVATDEPQAIYYHPMLDAPAGECPLIALPCSGESRIPFAYLVAQARIEPGARMLFTPKLPSDVTIELWREPAVPEPTTRVIWNAGPELASGHLRFSPTGRDNPTSATIHLPASHRADRIYTLQAAVDMPSGEVVHQSAQLTFMTSPRAGKIDIDGALGDWPKHAPIRLDNEDQLTSQWRRWDGPADASALVYTAWDKEYFYIAAEVQDNDISGPVTNSDSYYKNDGLEVYFDSDFDGDRDQTRYSDDDHQLGLFVVGDKEVAWHFSHGNGAIEGAKVTFNRAPQAGQTISGKACRYIVEAAIPVAAVHLQPAGGKLIGFNVGLSDDDDANTIHPFGPEVQLMWNGAKGGWQNPQKFAQLFLVEPSHDGASPGH